MHIVMLGLEIERFHLSPDSYGIDRAKSIIVGLQNWIKHISPVEVSDE